MLDFYDSQDFWECHVAARYKVNHSINHVQEQIWSNNIKLWIFNIFPFTNCIKGSAGFELQVKLWSWMVWFNHDLISSPVYLTPYLLLIILFTFCFIRTGEGFHTLNNIHSNICMTHATIPMLQIHWSLYSASLSHSRPLDPREGSGWVYESWQCLRS